MTGALVDFDEACDRLLDRVRGHALSDRVMYGASALGDFSLIWLLIGAARGITSERRADEAIRLAGMLGAESLIVNQGIKRLFRRGRPVFDGEHPHELRVPLTSSFPSGHASSAFFAAALLSQPSKRAAPLWYALAAVVATSRPYVRVHHATDVVGGAVVGAVLGAVARRIVPLPSRAR